MAKPMTPLHKRLWDRVGVHGGAACWEFTGPRNRGYGVIGTGGRKGPQIGAHRAAWLVTYGLIPEGLDVCRHCDNPPCCRPDHLFLGTRADNMLDAARKNRTGRAKLTWAQRQEIIYTYSNRLATGRHIAEACGVSRSAVENMVYEHKRRLKAGRLDP